MAAGGILLGSTFSLLWACIAVAADSPLAIYDQDPSHLWNRLHRAIVVRAEGESLYGVDTQAPFVEAFDDSERVSDVLDEFLEVRGEGLVSDNVKRALLLHDAWAAFDLAARGEHEDLRRDLAAVIGRLRMQDQAIADLPDNYTAAVKSGHFRADNDPLQPESGFLPADLFDANGAWVEIGESGRGSVAPVHVEAFSGRSAFRVFIRCPGGRRATLAYLERLNLHRTPWAQKPAEIGTTDPDERQVRMDPALDPGTPQFPEGTMLALARQMVLINSELEPKMSPITQSLQFRVFKRVKTDRDPRIDFPESQLVFEFALRRRDLLAGKSGGLHQVAPDETEFQVIGGLHGDRETRLRGSVVLSTCRRCHSANGIFSVNSYTRPFGPGTTNPQLLPADVASYQGDAAIAWKKRQFDWGLLRGLLEREP